MDTNKDYLNRIYNLARMRGLCNNKSEFASLLGMNISTLSRAFQGDEKYLTANFIRRVKTWASQTLPEDFAAESDRPVYHDPRPDIRIPAATMDLYTSMAKSIDRLTALVERMQPGASAFAGAAVTAPKNYRVED